MIPEPKRLDLEEIKATDLLGVGPGEDIKGLDVGDPGWTGNKHRLKPPIGKSGYQIDCEGHKIVSPETIGLALARRSGVTRLVGGTIVMPDWKGVGAGMEKQTPLRGDLFQWIGGVLEGNTGKWGIHTRGFDVDLKDCTIRAILGEHGAYVASPARFGFRVRGCTFEDQRYEAWKNVQRPWENGGKFVRGLILLEGNTFKNCASGVVLQGTGCNVQLKRNVFLDCDRPIAIDDGLSSIRPGGQGRYFDHVGIPEGSGAANGHVLLEEQAIEGSGELITVNEIFPLGGESASWEHDICRSLTIRRCGLWGEDAIVNIPKRHSLAFQTVANNNTDEIQAWCRSELGMDATHEAAVYQ